ncbi:MAG: TIGR01777 family oxidoreductase [Flavobacteriales bacterium]
MPESVNKECVLICGGTGLIGTILRPFLIEQGYEVCVLSRRQSNSYTYHWDPKLKEFPIQLLNKVDHIINLSGLSLMKRWTASYKKKLLRSRTIPTRFLHEVLSSNPHQVKTFINASGINIYGDNGDKKLTETNDFGDGFIQKLCIEWESEAQKIRNLGIRTAIFRISPVLHKQGEFVSLQMRLAKFGLLGRVGDGQQLLPWIQAQDLIGMILFALQNENCNAVYNACAPHPISQLGMNAAFEALAQQKQFVPPVPSQLIRLTLGERGALLTESLNAYPKAILELGYTFKFNQFKEALKATIEEQ